MKTQAPSHPGYFRWRAGEETPPIALSRTVMAAIARAVLGSFQPRGPEAGGVLLGSRDPQSGEFLIDDYEALPSEPEAIAARYRTPRLIGLYRSQTRPGFAVTPDDCALVEELLPRHEGVLLLVKPLSATECVGTFFLCEGGMVVDEAAGGREFPLSAIAPRPLPTPRRWLKALVPVTAAIVGIGLALVIHNQHDRSADEAPAAFAAPSPAASDAPIALKAVSSGNLIHVSWDGASPSLQGAPGALLTVSDGDRTSSLNLQNADLRRGALDWRPLTRNVTFQMKVNRANAEPLTEFTRAAAADDPINSSSAFAPPKPSPLADASAASGEQDDPVETAPAPETQQVRRRAETRVQGTPRRQPGRVKRVFGGITSKASHLWPFHSGRQD